MMKLDFKESLLLLVSALLACLAKAETLPQYSEDAHMGVATCASSVCHGSVRPRSSTSVSQNEYVVWSSLNMEPCGCISKMCMIFSVFMTS